MGSAEKKEILEELEEFIKNIDIFRNSWRKLDVGFDCSFFNNIPYLQKRDSLVSFLAVPSHFPEEKSSEKSIQFISFIEKLSRLYNAIVTKLATSIEQANPTSFLLSKLEDRIDPTKLSDKATLL